MPPTAVPRQPDATGRSSARRRPTRRAPAHRSRARFSLLLPGVLVLLLALALSLLTATAPARAAAAPTVSARTSIEDYASYQPATRCSPRARAGTRQLGRWLVKRYGGRYGSISRSCGGSTSEHTEGRAFDWGMDARTAAGRKSARTFLERMRATDKAGNTDALARRMGIMYVIWNDRMYAAWNQFEPEPYLSSSCKSRKKCSPTLRHRDHLHVSLTRKAARAQTSWYLARTR